MCFSKTYHINRYLSKDKYRRDRRCFSETEKGEGIEKSASPSSGLKALFYALLLFQKLKKRNLTSYTAVAFAVKIRSFAGWEPCMIISLVRHSTPASRMTR